MTPRRRWHPASVALALLAVVFLAGGTYLAGFSVQYQSVGPEIREIKTPRYLKIAHFLYRDYVYRRLAGDVTQGITSDRGRLLAIFNWTKDNIAPRQYDSSLADDHVLNIIIRGYGMHWQMAEVFATLATYAGYPTIVYRMRPMRQGPALTVALVKQDKRWLYFDAFFGVYFETAQGRIAGVQDLMKGDGLVPKGDLPELARGKPYRYFWAALRPLPTDSFVRAYLQMPSRRLWYECKRLLGLEGRLTQKTSEIIGKLSFAPLQGKSVIAIAGETDQGR